MRQFVLMLLSVAALSLGAGCAVSPAVPSQRAWAQRQGGTVAGQHEQRAQAILERLRDALGAPAGVRVAVLDNHEASAYAWPAGQLYVTRGLMMRLSDDELAAALAHELGHLLADNHLAPPASLRGCADEGGADDEMRADAVGRRILLAAGLPDDAMVRMLRKLQAAACSAECRTGIAQRIASLDFARQ